MLHGGSFNGHTASVAAALATLDELARDGVYERMTARGTALMDGLRGVAQRRGVPLLVQGLGTVFNTSFSDGAPVTDYRSFARHCDAARLGPFLHALQEAGVRPTESRHVVPVDGAYRRRYRGHHPRRRGRPQQLNLSTRSW